MKNLTLIMVLLLLAGCSSAPTRPVGSFERWYVQKIDMSKGEIYGNALEWIADNFRSAKAVIELQDKERGVIVGNGSTGYDFRSPFGVIRERARFKMKIEAKEGKYRLSFMKVELWDRGNKIWFPIEKAARPDLLEPGVAAEFDKIGAEVKAYLESSDARKEF